MAVAQLRARDLGAEETLKIFKAVAPCLSEGIYRNVKKS